jgi:NAD(P)-dependent dehydrogenase (short-subunit alcohol dehydrogenase family)
MNNKCAVITGASGGLGSEIAITLCKAGYKIFLTGRNREALRVLSERLGDNCFGFYICDLEKDHEIESLVSTAHTMSPTGNIDILINCAGIFPVGSIEKTEIKEFDKCYNINVRAPFILSKLFYPIMKNSKWGRIVNIGSSSAYAGFRNTAAYCSSKHGLLGLTRAMYDEFKEDGIRVFSISPGSIQTSMGEKVLEQDYSTFINPKELADFICHIISYDTNMISEEVRVNRMYIR